LSAVTFVSFEQSEKLGIGVLPRYSEDDKRDKGTEEKIFEALESRTSILQPKPVVWKSKEGRLFLHFRGFPRKSILDPGQFEGRILHLVVQALEMFREVLSQFIVR
jgi:hypothetical protein